MYLSLLLLFCYHILIYIEDSRGKGSKIMILVQGVGGCELKKFICIYKYILDILYILGKYIIYNMLLSVEKKTVWRIPL